jgi:mannosyltransferase OCH1-like enzyme
MTALDRREFVIKYFPEYLKFFDSLKHNIQRADMIRPMWLYVVGGVYMDLDYEVIKDLKDLFVDGGSIYLTPTENITGNYSNAFLASVPEHPFWLYYLKRMTDDVEWWSILKDIEIANSTGQNKLQKCVKEYNLIFTLIPTSKTNPCRVCDIGLCKGEFIHPIEGQSWNSPSSLVMNTVFCYWKQLISIIIIIVVYIIFRKKLHTHNS